MIKLIVITTLIAANGGAGNTKTEMEFKTLSACSTAAADFPAFEIHTILPGKNEVLGRTYNHAYCIEEGK